MCELWCLGGYRGEASALEEDFVIWKKIERLLEKGKSVYYAGKGGNREDNMAKEILREEILNWVCWREIIIDVDHAGKKREEIK